MSQTTKRYKANSECTFDCFDLQSSDEYQFGCEFEFYIDTDKYEYLEVIEKIKDEVFNFSNVDILVDINALPSDPDKNQCIQIKPDQSLGDNGIEISIPITSQAGVKHYIENILPIIEMYGYTNEDTGLHFHISTAKTDGVNFNFYLYMLICHDRNLLSTWQPRTGYSHNVMDVLLNKTKSLSRQIKNKKGTIWNLEKLSPNHIEIKSVGGTNYHKEISKILTEFDMHANYFDTVFKDSDPEYRIRLVKEHKKIIATIDSKTQEEFSKAVIEAGLID